VSELVRLCAVDFLTREILVDTYVNPKHRVVAWRSKFSGVTKGLLTDMIQQGRTVDGWQAARALLWQHIDEDTILIGHSLNNDLNVLGMIHTRVVDSAILTKDTVEPDCNRCWALKTLCQRFLDWEIQAGAAGHDCIEDTFAAREILLWCLQHPDQLRNWAAIERDLLAKKKAEKAATMRNNNEAKEKERKRR
jgi:DNA polymerase III epsilon subunit-like protein